MNLQSPGTNKEERRGQSQTRSNRCKKKGLKGSSETLPGGRHKAKVSGGGLQTGRDGWGRPQQGQGWRPGGAFRQETGRPLILKLGLELGQVRGSIISRALLMPCCPFFLHLSVFHGRGHRRVTTQPGAMSSFCPRKHEQQRSQRHYP